MADTSNYRLYQKIRWTVFFSLFIGYSAYYFARKSYTFAIPSMLQELNLQKSELGVITSGFAAMYGVSKFCSGLLSDSMSPRTMFAVGMFLTGIINIIIGFSNHVWLFAVLWSVNGLVQGCGWPPCARLLREWFSPHEVGTVWSLLTAGCNLASSVSPVLTAYLTTNHGWSAAFTTPGFVAVIVSFAAYFLLRDSPVEVSLAEFSQTHTKTNKPQTKATKKGQIRALLRSPFLWVLCGGYLMTLFVKTAVGEWTQLFLMQSKEKTHYEAGIAISFLEVGGLVGSVFSGYITDKLLLKYGISTVSSPRLPPMVGFAIVQLACLYLLHTAVSSATSLWLVSCLIFGTGFALYGSINTYGVLAMENGPPGFTGTSHAIVALAANVGATMAGYPLTMISKFYSWNGMFMTIELASLLCLCLLVGARNVNKQMIDPSKME